MALSFLHWVFPSLREPREQWMTESTPETVLAELTHEIQTERMRLEEQDLGPFESTFGLLSSDCDVTTEQIVAAISKVLPDLDPSWINSVPSLMRVIQFHSVYPFMGLDMNLTSSSLLRAIYTMSNRSRGLYGSYNDHVKHGEKKIVLYPRLKKDRLQMWFWALATGDNWTDDGQKSLSPTIHEVQEQEILKLVAIFQDNHIPHENFRYGRLDMEKLRPVAIRLSSRLPDFTVATEMNQDVFEQWAKLIEIFSGEKGQQSSKPVAAVKAIDIKEFEAFAERTQMFTVISDVIDKAFFQTNRDGKEDYGQIDFPKDQWKEMGLPEPLDIS